MSLEKLKAEGVEAVGSSSEEVLAQAILDLDARITASERPDIKIVPLSEVAAAVATALETMGHGEGSVAIDLAR